MKRMSKAIRSYYSATVIVAFAISLALSTARTWQPPASDPFSVAAVSELARLMAEAHCTRRRHPPGRANRNGVPCDIQSAVGAPITTDDDTYDDRYSFSADQRWLAFTRESTSTPSELFLKAFPSGNVRAVTRVANAFPLTPQLRVDRVRWPSRDARFTIHGLLVTPRSARGSDAEGLPTKGLPTLVFVHGGPSMVRAGFATDGYNGAITALAARGYAVLVPNTRGRGGYGEALERGMRDGRSAGRLP